MLANILTVCFLTVWPTPTPPTPPSAPVLPTSPPTTLSVAATSAPVATTAVVGTGNTQVFHSIGELDTIVPPETVLEVRDQIAPSAVNVGAEPPVPPTTPPNTSSTVVSVPVTAELKPVESMPAHLAHSSATLRLLQTLGALIGAAAAAVVLVVTSRRYRL